MKICKKCLFKAFIVALMYFSFLLGGLLYLISFKNHSENKVLSSRDLCYGDIIALSLDSYTDEEKCLIDVFPIVKFRPPYNYEIDNSEIISLKTLTNIECGQIKAQTIEISGVYAKEVFTSNSYYEISKWLCVTRSKKNV